MCQSKSCQLPHNSVLQVLQQHTRVLTALSGITQVSQYQKGKTNLDFTEARDSKWQWHQLGRTQVCTSLQTDNHASTPPLRFLQARCPSYCPTNSVKALKETSSTTNLEQIKVMELEGYSQPTCNELCASSNDLLDSRRCSP